MKVKILKKGVSQQRDGKTYLPKVGEILDVSPEAADHLIRDGYAEAVMTQEKPND